MKEAKVRKEITDGGFECNPLDHLVSEGFELVKELLHLCIRANSSSLSNFKMSEEKIKSMAKEIEKDMLAVERFDEETLTFCRESSQVLKHIDIFEEDIKKLQELGCSNHIGTAIKNVNFDDFMDIGGDYVKVRQIIKENNINIEIALSLLKEFKEVQKGKPQSEVFKKYVNIFTEKKCDFNKRNLKYMLTHVTIY